LLLVLGDVALILAATQLAPLIRLGQAVPIFEVHTGASTFTVLLYMTMLYIFDLYSTGRRFDSKDTALRLGVAVVVAGFFSAFLFYSFPSWKYGRGIFLIQMILVWGLLTGWRRAYLVIFPRAARRENVLVLGAGRCGMTLYHMLDNGVSPYTVVGFLDDDPAKQGKIVGSPRVLGTIGQLPEIAKENCVRTAILAISRDRSHELIYSLMQLRFKGLTVLDMPTVCERLTGRLPVNHTRDGWLAFASGFYLLSKEHLQKTKRLVDFCVSALLLAVTAPIAALTALAIKIESPGPVFFKQARVGKHGGVFIAWKFRSMYRNAEENGAVWARENDSRITRVGRWIRRLRIDEIPQLYNVFRGEMSLIGPRPERPEFVRELERQIPYYGLRHSVQPGITGWAQVNYRYGASVEDALHKLEYDLYYIKNMSLLLDLKIILKTIGVVLLAQGAR
jgi:sugar transferase (PEP-CTERM system associated)